MDLPCQQYQHYQRFPRKRKADFYEDTPSLEERSQKQRKLTFCNAQRGNPENTFTRRPRFRRRRRQHVRNYRKLSSNSALIPITEACSSDDSSRDRLLKKNEILYSPTNKYQVLEFSGEGTFGQVVICWSERTRDLVALKIVKETASTLQEGLREVNILQRLCEENVDDFNVVRLYENFVYKNHMCLVFEILEQSLYNFLQQRNFCPLPLNGIRVILKQVLTTLVKLQELQIIHADLKPENIMLVDSEKNPFHVKVIDFGNAIVTSLARVDGYIQTRYYRSPEVILGLPFTEAIDMWSLGCVAAELYFGVVLYPGQSEYDQIRYIVETHGTPTTYMMDSATKATKFFYRETRGEYGTWRLKTPDEYEKETNIKSQEYRAYVFNSLDEMAEVNLPTDLEEEDYYVEMRNRAIFINLLKRMLTLDQMLRISPAQALRHDFFNSEEM